MNGKPRLYIDQYGQHYWARTVKELCEKLGSTKAHTMYQDRGGKPPVRVGYVIGPYWLDRYIPDYLPV